MDEQNTPIEQNMPEAIKPPKLIIEMTEDGNLLVTGPLHNRYLCNGMLDDARDIIKNHHNKTQAPKIMPPHRIMDFLRNGKKD